MQYSECAVLPPYGMLGRRGLRFHDIASTRAGTILWCGGPVQHYRRHD